MSAYLVDTNVLAYAYDSSDGAKRAGAPRVLENRASSGQGAFSPQILCEFLVTATRKIPSPLSPEQAQRRVSSCLRSWKVLSLTGWTVLEATQGVVRHQMSYWDALVWATAKMNQVPTVLSEDFAGGMLLEGVRFHNPFVTSFELEGVR